MHKKFEVNQTKIKGGSQSGRKVVAHNSKSDLPLAHSSIVADANAESFIFLRKTKKKTTTTMMMIMMKF